jgi:glycosyltransferase involved in cell wall biosynthesis
MKITHILNYSWENGGSSKVVHDIAFRQMEEGFDVCIISIDKTGHKPYLSIKGVEILLFKPHFFARFFPLFSLELLKVLKSRNFDLIHLHGLWNFTLLATFWLGLFDKAILTVHGCLNPYTFKGKFIKRALFTYSFQKRCLKKLKVIHVFHQKEKEYVEAYLGKPHANIKIIPNGIKLKNNILDNLARFESKEVLFLSRLDPIKGLDLLLPAFKLVLEKVPNAKLNIAGPDFGMLAFVENFIIKNNLAKSIKYLGVLTGSEKEKVQTQANIFALPSYSEGFSIAVLEALNEGIPVVVSQETGLSDDILTYKAGNVVAYNEKSIADSIIQLLENPETAKIYVKNARILLNDKFKIGLILDKMISLTYLYTKK